MRSLVTVSSSPQCGHLISVEPVTAPGKTEFVGDEVVEEGHH